MNKLTASCLIIASSFLFACSDEKIPEHLVSIEAPFKNVKVEQSSFTINPAEDKVIRLADGSSLDIPANAFVDKEGNLITTPVTLTYKEYDDPAEIIASGIPMTCEDKDGKVQQFESGGMFELRGMSNGKDVSIAPNKNIGVNMATNIEGDYDFFYLQETDKQQEATASFIPSANAQTVASAQKKYYWKKIEVAKKENATEEDAAVLFSNDPKAPRFKLKFDATKNPDLKILDDINWQYAGTQQKENPLAKENSQVLTNSYFDVDISQPRYKLSTLKTFPLRNPNENEGLWNGFLIFNQQNDRYIFDGANNTIQICDWNGKVLKSIPNKILATQGMGIFLNFPKFFESRYKNYFMTTEVGEKNYSAEKITIFNFDGKEICSVQNSSELEILEKSQRITYLSDDSDGKSYLHICRIDGTLIKKIPFTKEVNGQPYYFHPLRVNQGETQIATLTEREITIYSINGDVIATRARNDKETNIHFTARPDILVIEEDGVLIAWNWKTNQLQKQIVPGKKLKMDLNYNRDFAHYSSFHKSLPLVLVTAENEHDADKPAKLSALLWNVEKNSIETIVDNKAARHINTNFSPGGNFFNIIIDGKELYCYNLKSKLIYSSTSKDRFYNQYSKNDSVVVINGSDNVKALSCDGKLLIDFTKFDSLTTYALFTEDGNIISSSSTGNVYLWATDGKLLKRVLTPDNRSMDFVISIKGDSTFYTYHGEYYHIWDYNGKLLHTISKCMPPFAMSNNDGQKLILQQSRNSTQIELSDLFKTRIEKGVWQLTLYYGQTTFTTFVRLTEEDYKKILAFLKAKRAKLEAKRMLQDKENTRVQQEEEVIRSFQVAEFGIYNWDRFYKEDSALKIALTLDFDTINTAYSNFSAFLITGENMSTVIRYSSKLENFSFIPEYNNILLVVLPGDRIAIFDQEAFKKYNKSNTKEGQAVTFKMKILDKQASMDELKKILNNKPS